MKFSTAALWLACATLANAKTLYVSNHGSTTVESCTMDLPCSSIQTAVDLAEPYDTILIENGIFVENVVVRTEGIALLGGQEFNKDERRLPKKRKPKYRYHAETVIESAGGTGEAPAGVPVDVVLDIFAPHVTIMDITFRHPATPSDKRDVGLFVRPPALDAHIFNVKVQRFRQGEPTQPGSRGLLGFQATGILCEHSAFTGYYQDHIHLPTSKATIAHNHVKGATRIGIVVIQESETSLSEHNSILDNWVIDSASDGIQIQGDTNWIIGNHVRGNKGYGLHICSPGSGCVAPGGDASADENIQVQNSFFKNDAGDTWLV